MKLNEILTISGHSGLFKLISQGKNNIIVESLVDGKRMPAFITDRISSIADIALFTKNDDLPLKEVFMKMYQTYEGKPVELNLKTQQKEAIALFEKAIPDYDNQRVYYSDIKKIITWYNQLLKAGLLPFSEEVQQDKEKEIQNKE